MNKSASNKRYTIIGVEANAGWPAEDTRITFQSTELLLRPPDKDRAPSIVIEYEQPATHDEQVKIAQQFLSSWAWAEGVKLEVGLISGGSTPHWVGRNPSFSSTRKDFDLQYLPAPNDSKTKLALAFYREAINLVNISYKFLSFFKILNILNERGPEQRNWIKAALPHLRDSSARQRISELTAADTDVATYLWESGRCAVAHAFSSPLINPEDPNDLRRLHQDLPLIKSLAEYLIEHEMDVKSRQTIWKEHLYELEGFRKLLGDSLIARIKNKEDVPVDEIPTLPRMTLGIYRQPELNAFTNMDVRIIEIKDGCVGIEAVAVGGQSGVVFGLNFAHERLAFSPEQNAFILNQHDVATAENMIDRLNLIRGLVLNGQLQILNAESGEILGRTDPCIPVNIDGGKTIRSLDENIRYLQEEILWHQYWNAK